MLTGTALEILRTRVKAVSASRGSGTLRGATLHHTPEARLPWCVTYSAGEHSWYATEGDALLNMADYFGLELEYLVVPDDKELPLGHALHLFADICGELGSERVKLTNCDGLWEMTVDNLDKVRHQLSLVVLEFAQAYNVYYQHYLCTREFAAATPNTVSPPTAAVSVITPAPRRIGVA